MRDKIILVFYIGCASLNREDIPEFLNHIADSFRQRWDDSVETIFIPCVEEVDTRIECVNPKLVNQDAYDEAMNVVEKFKSKTNEILETLKKDKTNG